ncbi:hypothetical protein PFICI_04232 [Pestalotiopsis fici W106-1]|uniref:Uncharacterized protein n=1 Tax=Pestalotiopsis fici (strain W106-1 / CGMCC3.15140) TaxID=1229662 RepID=W3XB04_PESFW|nr:uncharacterized protein PFICI_04232 [Pestalotiopsis fici W106-1]ETS82356.1 hypothetical protein PFICI_04232 [Pestalotiopsis fici W106-1]
MKLAVQTALLAALLSAVDQCLATSHHRHHHRRHSKPEISDRNTTGDIIHQKNLELKARGLDTCTFPSSDGLIAITPGSDNAGWAMSPDQPCTCGSYCPYACPPGQVSAQWKDGSTYATTDRMAGGLYCGLDGKAVKPFTSKPFCVDGTGTVQAVNKVGKVVSFCQTVLPGNEDILIPNDVSDTLTLAVPDTSYWQSTASHFYINPPGVDSDKGCHWGDDSTPIGNWAPYVAGANTDASGLTYVKVGTNPIWQGSSLYDTKPTFGLKIECTSGSCVGLPCTVDGSGVTSDLKATGAGGSDFCVVTVPKGGQANIVVYSLDGSSDSATTSSVATTTSKAQPTTTSTTSTSTSTSSTTSTTSSSKTTSTSTSSSSTSSTASSTTLTRSSSSSPAKSSSSAVVSLVIGGIFQENGTTTASETGSSSAQSTAAATTGDSAGSGESSTGSAQATESSKSESSAAQGNGAIAGLIVAIVAAACIL